MVRPDPAASEARPAGAPASYRAPWWLPGGHLQTIYAALWAQRPTVRLRRCRWETPDADFIDLDWLDDPDAVRDSPPARPLVVLFHGLEGGSKSHYATALMAAVRALGWNGVVVLFRGCSGELNRLRRAYHSGDSAEIDWVLRRLKREHPDAPLFAAGVSLGGNALLKWLGEQRAAAGAVIQAAAAISAPVDLTAAGNALDRGCNLIYTRSFLATMKQKTFAKLAHYPDLCNRRALRTARTLREFDDLVTAPLHGYRDTDHYWSSASSKPWLKHIAVETLMINAQNDPFLPRPALPHAGEVATALHLEFPAAGGHAGFVSGRFPGQLDWLPQRVLAFFADALARTRRTQQVTA